MPRSNLNGIRNSSTFTYTNLSGGGNSGYTHASQDVGVYEVTSGVSRRKPSGWIPPTPYSFYRKDVNFPKGTSDVRINFWNWSKRSGNPGDTPDGSFNPENHFNEAALESSLTAGPPGLANLSLIRARLALKGQSVNLGVAFAERNRTARLVGDTASNIASAFRSLRRGETRNAMRALGISSSRREPRGSNVPKKWLELQYGWKPLLMDVHGAADALSKYQPRDWRVTAKGYATDEEVRTSYRGPYQWGNFDACSVTARCKAMAMTRIDALPANEAIISLGSLGVLNPLSVGWEIVPYSFVVDWFIPIGDYLNSLDAMWGYGDAYSSTSIFTRSEWIDTGLSKTFSPDSWIKNNYIATKRVVRLERTASSGVSLPTLPSFKDPRSLGHMANGLSLLAQAFGRR